MDFLQQPAIRAVSTFVFVVTVLAMLDAPRVPSLLGCLILVPIGLTRLRAFACGAAFGLTCWAIHAHTGQTLVTDSARHAVYVQVEVTDFRQTPSGSVGEGVLRQFNGRPTDLNVRLLGDDVMAPGTVWTGAAQVEVLSGPWSLDTTDSKWLAERRGGGLVLRMTATNEVVEPPIWRWPQQVLFHRRNSTETLILNALADPWRGIALALATGNKAWLDEDLAQEFVDTGHKPCARDLRAPFLELSQRSLGG
ncbi:MAG: hypothetical protein R3E66_11395 [bacterium]